MSPFVRSREKGIPRSARNDSLAYRLQVCAWVLLVATGPLLAAEGLPPTWEGWRYWRPVELSESDTPRLVRATLPIQIYGRARAGLGDLRVIDDTGTEIPYVLHAREGSRRKEWLEARLGEVSFVPGPPTAYTQIEVDLGEKVSPHNQLEIETDEKEFFARVELGVSDDARSWRLLLQQEPIYRFEKTRLPGNQTLSYSESRARYLRLRIYTEKSELFRVQGVRVAREVAEEAEWARLETRFSARPEAPQGRSWWQADLGGARVPAAGVRFKIQEGRFHRAVEVHASDDAQRWRRVGQGEIYRRGGNGGDRAPTRELLRFEFGEARGRYWRVAVLDGDDPPLRELEIELWGTPRHVVFRQSSRQSYRLLYGNERAAAPQYELARLLSRDERELTVAGAVGAEEANTAWVDPRPWSERHPVVLWVVLGIMVVGLGFLALRSLRQSMPEENHP